MKVIIGYKADRAQNYEEQERVYPDRAAAIAAIMAPGFAFRHGQEYAKSYEALRCDVKYVPGSPDTIVRNVTMRITSHSGVPVESEREIVTTVIPVEIDYQGSPGAICEALRNALASVECARYIDPVTNGKDLTHA